MHVVPATTSSKGVKFGKYELIYRIAEGGMAEIFLAIERGIEGMERRVVVKRILSERTQVDDFVTMFTDEARLATRLTHPNIAHVYSFGEVDGLFFLAMEYVEGLTVSQLKRRLKGELIPPQITLRIIGDVCAGLHYAHELSDDNGRRLGVVHRDVSPQNIMVSKNGVAKLIDFGVARAATHVHVSGMNQVKGKIAYMAPEMLSQRSGIYIDHRADVFAAGVVLFEMISGIRLFRRESEAAIVMAIRSEEPPSVVEFGGSAELDAIIRRAVEKDPEKRYATAQQMQDDIERLIAEGDKTATPYVIGRFMIPHVKASRRAAEGNASEESLDMLLCQSTSPSPFDSVPRLYDENTDLDDISDNGDVEGFSEEEDLSLQVSFDDEPAGLDGFQPDRSITTESAELDTDLPFTSRQAVWISIAGLASVMIAGIVVGLIFIAGSEDSHRRGTSVTSTGSSGGATESKGGAQGAQILAATGTAADSGVSTKTVDDGSPEKVDTATPATPPQPESDGGHGETGAEPVKTGKRPVKRVAVKRGTLFVDTEPWSRVRAGSRSLGTTPVIGATLPAGAIVLRFVDADGNRHRRRVVINSGKATKVFFRLQR